jgi:hypothetical protein
VVDEGTYARLARLAAERGVTVDQWVAQLTRSRPARTDAERRDIAGRTDEYLRDQFGFDVTPAEREAFAARLARRTLRRASA